MMLSFVALATALLLSLAAPSLALDTIRLGKAVPNSFAFGAAEVGIDAKIFAGDGLDVTVSSFRGDAQLQQALAAGSVDVGLGSGPGLGFRVDRGRGHVRRAAKSRALGGCKVTHQERR
jgi:NitT/TauT family transport system substrate-binding protein